MARRPRILVVNDDGIHGEGLEPLVLAFSALGETAAVVPERERSADSHCLSLRSPLRVRRVRPGFFAVDGSPADCARLGALELFRRPDLVVSGINRGFNLGSDVVYSGTVAGAMEGVILGLPALALSRGIGKGDYSAAAALAVRVGRELLRRGLPPGVCLSLNVPALPLERIRGVRVTALGRRIYGRKVTLRKDPYGLPYYWLAGRYVSGHSDRGSDIAAIREGYASLTPLHVDTTHRASLTRLRAWKLR